MLCEQASDPQKLNQLALGLVLLARHLLLNGLLFFPAMVRLGPVICIRFRVPVGQKTFKRLVSAIETENLKNLKTAVHLVNCTVN